MLPDVLPFSVLPPPPTLSAPSAPLPFSPLSGRSVPGVISFPEDKSGRRAAEKPAWAEETAAGGDLIPQKGSVPVCGKENKN